jgi:hypothetical protein
VPCIEQPVKLTSTPAWLDVDADIEHRGYAPQGIHADGGDVASFDQGHHPR